MLTTTFNFEIYASLAQHLYIKESALPIDLILTRLPPSPPKIAPPSCHGQHHPVPWTFPARLCPLRPVPVSATIGISSRLRSTAREIVARSNPKRSSLAIEGLVQQHRPNRSFIQSMSDQFNNVFTLTLSHFRFDR